MGAGASVPGCQTFQVMVIAQLLRTSQPLLVRLKGGNLFEEKKNTPSSESCNFVRMRETQIDHLARIALSIPRPNTA